MYTSSLNVPGCILGAPTASPRRERKSKPKPSSTEKESEVKGEGKPRGEEHRVRRKKFSENIRVDAQQLIKEEEMKKRAERKRQRRQADQAVTKGDTVEEEVGYSVLCSFTCYQYCI